MLDTNSKNTQSEQSVLEKLKKIFEDFIKPIESEPITIVILGQTGVGKTSLINALFNVNLPTGDVSPITKEPQSTFAYDKTGKKLLVFWDMPGVGESEEADEKYLMDYRTKIINSDIAIWAIHADTRSVTFDIQTIKKIISPLSVDDKKKLISKISFIITKCDLVSKSPWILGKNKELAQFATSKETENLLDQKADYFRSSLLVPFKSYFESRAHHIGEFSLPNRDIAFDGNFVTYQGLIEKSEVEQLVQQYPQYRETFINLYNNTKVTYCSAKYRFNLPEVMNTIVNRTKDKSIVRLKKFIENKINNHISWVDAKNFSNILVFDELENKIIYDLNKIP